jgi:DNA-binding winged helix-turn-helix (wHTH) protein
MSRYTFGRFELDPEARLLRRDGEPVPLGGKTLDTLVVLVENRGRLVDKGELLSRVWAGSVVEEANLTQTIFTVRKVLGDSPKDHRYIATVAGRGYQFVAPVTEFANSTPPVTEPQVPPPEPRQAPRKKNVRQVVTVLALCALTTGLVLESHRLHRFQPAFEHIRSLAVLHLRTSQETRHKTISPTV